MLPGAQSRGRLRGQPWRRGYHTSLPLYLPDRKATVEKAVDTLKEKKKKEKSAESAQMVSVVEPLTHATPPHPLAASLVHQRSMSWFAMTLQLVG